MCREGPPVLEERSGAEVERQAESVRDEEAGVATEVDGTSWFPRDSGLRRAISDRADDLGLALRGVLSFLTWSAGYFGFMYIFFQFVGAFYHVFAILLPEWLGMSLFFMVMLPSFCIGFACFNLSYARDPILATCSMLIDAALISSLEDLPWHVLLALMSFMYTTKPLIHRMVSKAGSALNIDPARLTFRRWEQQWDPLPIAPEESHGLSVSGAAAGEEQSGESRQPSPERNDLEGGVP